MLKRRPRVARARLPAAAPAAHVAAIGQSALRPVAPWPEPPATVRELWLCIGTADGHPDAERLARLALHYSSVVSIVPGYGVLLEVAGSLRLFDGLDNLRRRLLANLGESDLYLACALTPRAACWLAAAPAAIITARACVTPEAMRLALSALPISVTGWPDNVQRQLAQFGVRALGDCLRLPRDGFARRSGRECLQQLDEALGRRPQPLARYVPSEYFSARHELDAETTEHGQLLGVLDGLFGRLERFLRRRRAAVLSVQLHFVHHRLQATPLRLGVALPCAQRDRLLELVTLQLTTVNFPAPVCALTVRANPVVLPPSPGGSLPGIEPAGQATDPHGLPLLIDTLRARLGNAGVYALQAVAEHRPERAWRMAEPGAPATASLLPRRPLWLLAEPQPLRLAPAVLANLGGAPERIESGWWDGHDVRRDYYRITGPGGSCWWVYQDRRSAAWYLHGLFG